MAPIDFDRRAPLVLRWWMCILLLSGSSWISVSLQAESGDLIRRPAGPGSKKPKNGVLLVVDALGVDGNGYHPVRIELTNSPRGAATADREFCIVFQPRDYSPWTEWTEVTTYLELPQGASRAETTVCLPQRELWAWFRFEVYEDGRLLEELSGETSIYGTNQYWSKRRPTILVVDGDAPDAQSQGRTIRGTQKIPEDQSRRLPDLQFLAELSVPLDEPLEYVLEPELNDRFTLDALRSLPKVQLLSPGELPEKWIELSCFDLIFVPLSDLRTLVENEPIRWDAIRDWLVTGPTLCVYEMDLSPTGLRDLEQLLDLAPLPDTAGSDSNSGWQEPDEETVNEYVLELEDEYGPYDAAAEDGEGTDEEGTQSAPEEDEAERPDSPPFLVRSAGLGRVVAMETSEPFRNGRYGMPWLLNELGARNWLWDHRHGMAPDQENDEYLNWLVPGCGRTPVGFYLLLISAFVLVIGPLNYFVLRRKRRLYLLLVTVPVGSALVSFALLSYVMISDGLDLRTRIRSFTEIDQHAGQAVSWSRQSYYAGLAPSDGLAYPEHATVYPIVQFLGNEWRTRKFLWDEQQHLTAGYLRSRCTAQFLVVSSAATSRGLVVTRPENEADAPRITNNLATRIEMLVLSDDAGRCYWAEQVAPGQPVRPEAISLDEARTRITAAVQENGLKYPDGYDSAQYNSPYGYNQGSLAMYYGDETVLPPGMLERSIQQAAELPAPWAPRRYLAITSTSPETPMGSELAREAGSFHMIRGQW